MVAALRAATLFALCCALTTAAPFTVDVGARATGTPPRLLIRGAGCGTATTDGLRLTNFISNAAVTIDGCVLGTHAAPVNGTALAVEGSVGAGASLTLKGTTVVAKGLFRESAVVAAGPPTTGTANTVIVFDNTTMTLFGFGVGVSLTNAYTTITSSSTLSLDAAVNDLTTCLKISGHADGGGHAANRPVLSMSGGSLVKSVQTISTQAIAVTLTAATTLASSSNSIVAGAGGIHSETVLFPTVDLRDASVEVEALHGKGLAITGGGAAITAVFNAVSMSGRRPSSSTAAHVGAFTEISDASAATVSITRSTFTSDDLLQQALSIRATSFHATIATSTMTVSSIADVSAQSTTTVSTLLVSDTVITKAGVLLSLPRETSITLRNVTVTTATTLLSDAAVRFRGLTVDGSSMSFNGSAAVALTSLSDLAGPIMVTGSSITSGGSLLSVMATTHPDVHNAWSHPKFTVAESTISCGSPCVTMDASFAYDASLLFDNVNFTVPSTAASALFDLPNPGAGATLTLRDTTITASGADPSSTNDVALFSPVSVRPSVDGFKVCYANARWHNGTAIVNELPPRGTATLLDAAKCPSWSPAPPTSPPSPSPKKDHTAVIILGVVAAVAVVMAAVGILYIVVPRAVARRQGATDLPHGIESPADPTAMLEARLMMEDDGGSIACESDLESIAAKPTSGHGAGFMPTT